MKRKPIIRVVKRMPKRSGDAIGYHQPKTNRIYIKEGYDSPYLRAHETYHFIKNHPDKPRRSSTFIDHEIEAENYALKNSKRHRSRRKMVIAMLNSQRETYRYKNSALSTYKLIGERLRKNKADKEWQKGYKEAGKIVNDHVRKHGKRA